MFYRLVLFLVMFLSYGFVYSQSDTLNRTNDNGTKFGYWLVNYDNGKVKDEGFYVNGKKEGLWKSYYEDGKKQNEIIFKNNRPNGYAKFYFENGNISEEGLWKINKWVGEYKMYHQNGELSYDWKYSEKGKRTGEQKYFHSNGKIMIEGKWNEGKEDGVIKQYDDAGKLVSERSFVDGKQDPSSIKYYDKENASVTESDDNKEAQAKEKWPEGYKKVRLNKILQAEGVYENDKLKDGKKYYYNMEGELEKTVIYKDFKISDIQYN